MAFKKLKTDQDRIDDYKGRCPDCGSPTTFYHDLKCSICNQTTVSWCPQCEEHVVLDI
jgi:hypothetical protein